VSSKLAIDGGMTAVPEGMIKSWPPLTQADRDAVLEVFDSGHLHTIRAPKAVELQTRWAEYVGTKHALTCNGGTGALHMALIAAGVRPGDEVITSAFSFWASAAAVVHANAVPVFADIDPKSYTIDPALIEERITDHTKAILPVHIHGMPADMDPINDIARRHGLTVVEDACQGHGATYKGRRTGSLGGIGAFSLNRSKNLSGGEGGLVTTDSDIYFERAVKCQHFGAIRREGNESEDLVYGLGWMFRPHEFINALACSQLDRLEEHNAIRRRLAAYLTSELASIPGMRGPHTPAYADPCYFTYVVEFDPDEAGVDLSPGAWKRAAVEALRAEGLPMGQWQSVPVPAQDVFQDRVGHGRGCPWTCPHGSGDVKYDPAEYPRSQAFVEAHSYLTGVYPPNNEALMDRYLDAFHKISENATRVAELAGT